MLAKCVAVMYAENKKCKAEIKLSTSRQYFDFIAEQLSALDGVSYRQMMGEYIIYYKGRIIGGLYDDRMFIKPVRAAAELMPDASEQAPYDHAKPMLVCDRVDDREFLAELLEAVYPQLPESSKKTKK